MLVGSTPALAQPANAKAIVDAAKIAGTVGEQGDGLLGLVTGSADAATTAAVNEITLFRQFGSKDALLRQAIAHRHPGEVVALPARPEDPLRELTDFARSHLDRMRERRS